MKWRGPKIDENKLKKPETAQNGSYMEELQ
jgi:hypothetical protein